MYCKTLLVLAGVLLFATNPQERAQAQGTQKDYVRAFALPETVRKTCFNLRLEPHWMGGGSDFWYRKATATGAEFLSVFPETKARAPLFNHEKLAEALTKASGKTAKANDLPLADLQLAPNGTTATFQAFDKRWQVDFSTYAVREAPTSPPENAPSSLEGISPDGKWLAIVQNYDLFLTERAAANTRRITQDGTAQNYYGEVRWSPDSKRFVFYRITPGDHLKMPYLEAVPKEGLRPKVHEIEYALPGDKLDKHAMWVCEVESGKAVRVTTDPIENIYWDSPTPTWNTDNTGFWYRQLDRNYRRKRVYFVNARNGEAKTVLDERTNTFFSPLKDFWQVVDKSLLYLSDLDGWNHLYRYDAETGALLNRITQGNWEVRTAEILPNTDEILFSAGGREAGDPYLVHHYRVKFNGTGLIELTPEVGDNSFQRSPNDKYYLVTRSLVNQPPVHTLRRWSDGKEVMELERGEIAALEKTGWRRVEPFVAKGRDGTTDIYGVLYRPSHFNPSKKYPVVEFIYSGPHDAYAPKRFTPWDRNQKLAELGFIVVQVDGMGTAWRGRAFHEVCYRNLADSGFPDHIEWIRAAAEKYPQMDLNRVGIYGYSAGGYNALRALIAHSDFYKASVALCGNHDHRTDKTWWNELWMGDDIGKHYLEQSNVTNADKLQGKLLLVHGTEDENVYSFASTMRVADALIKANKDFEMFLVPGRGHNLAGDYVDRKIYDHFVRNLAGKEPRRPR